MLITSVNIVCSLYVKETIFEKCDNGLVSFLWHQKSVTVETQCDAEKTEHPLKLLLRTHQVMGSH